MKEKRDMQAGLFLLCLSVVLIVFAIPRYVEGQALSGLSPRFFPYLAAVMTGGFSLALIVSSRKAFLGNREESPHSGGGAEKGVNMRSFRPLIIIALLAVYFVLFERVGFFWATPTALAAMMYAFGQRNPRVILVCCAVVTGTLFCLFEYGMGVPLH